MLKKNQLLSIQLSVGTYDNFITEVINEAQKKVSKYICVSNVHMLVEAYLDVSFAKVVNNADIATPDGLPLTWALRLLSGIRQERVAGMSLLPDLLSRCEEEKLPVYFYGGTEALIKKTEAFISQRFPKLEVSGLYSPPFRRLTVSEEQEVVDQINLSGARIIFVVLGCPKQEKWMASMKGRIQSTMIGIGGALPVLIGMQKRAPVWMQVSGLEWLFRLGQDPRRLWKRYIITNSIFIYLLLVNKTKESLLKRNIIFRKAFP